jgi:hypothetical protein
VSNVIATFGNIGNVRIENGNVTIPGALSTSILTSNLIASFANVSNVIATFGNIGNVRIENGNVTIPGTLSIGILTSNLIASFANVSNVIATFGNIGNVRIENGNVSTTGNISAGLFVGNLSGQFANVSNVLIAGGNVSANLFIGSGALLTDIIPPSFTVVSGTSDVLTAGSARNRLYTSTSPVTVGLPNATTLEVGTTFIISSGQSEAAGTRYVRIQTNTTGSLLYNLCPSATCQVTLLNKSSSAGTWSVIPSGEQNAGLSYTLVTNTTLGAAAQNPKYYATLVSDPLNQYNTSNGRFTAVNDGWYTITASMMINNPSLCNFYIYVNDSYTDAKILQRNELTNEAGKFLLRGTITQYFTRGTYFTFAVDMAGGVPNRTIINDPASTYFTITKRNT